MTILEQIYPFFGKRPKISQSYNNRLEINVSTSALKTLSDTPHKLVSLLYFVFIPQQMTLSKRPFVDLYDFNVDIVLDLQKIDLLFTDKMLFSVDVYKRSVKYLVDNDVILRYKRGVYFVNPHYINAINPSERSMLANKYKSLTDHPSF